MRDWVCMLRWSITQSVLVCGLGVGDPWCRRPSCLTNTSKNTRCNEHGWTLLIQAPMKVSIQVTNVISIPCLGLKHNWQRLDNLLLLRALIADLSPSSQAMAKQGALHSEARWDKPYALNEVIFIFNSVGAGLKSTGICLWFPQLWELCWRCLSKRGLLYILVSLGSGFAILVLTEQVIYFHTDKGHRHAV